MVDGPLLALDVGGGTQDLFLWEPGQAIENAVKMVLPAPTQIFARRLARLTVQRQPVFFRGRLMGGGAVTQALRRHLAAGLPVSATPAAALTFNDDLETVGKWGVSLSETAPPGAVELVLGDLDPKGWPTLLRALEIPFPHHFAVAVQDHGHNPQGSNRSFRFQHWQDFLAQGGRLQDLAYRQPPPYLTRMRAVAEALPGVVLMDTCAAGVWGALLDPQAREHREEGLMVVNVGNAHTFAALVQGERLWGIYEHHTGLLTPAKLFDHLSRFLAGELTHQEVFDDLGHGCALTPGYPPGRPFSFTVITGPRRRLAQGWPGVFAVPGGDMMLTGCFGLADAFLKMEKIPIEIDELL
ncbi:MAG: hypothetical protein A2Y80_09975 [Deltaproteobacteria bacterium RBG_13_58_19]|nr:MAG: hypothetical protein A2Y80_09975 [Deltaproteobacteria bacterium RBG_13_58_19]